MTPETITALKNYGFILRHKGLEGADLHWESGTIVEEDGGWDIELLTKPGFTPATKKETN